MVLASTVEQISDTFFSRKDVYAYQWYNKERNAGGYAKACIHRPPWVTSRCPIKHNGVSSCASCQSFEPLPVDYDKIERHLTGEQTMGAYQLGNDGTSTLWGCVDFDDHGRITPEEMQSHTLVAKMALEDYGIKTHMEMSGGHGWRCHLWAFFSQPVHAGKLRLVVKNGLKTAGLDQIPDIEVFPKQSSTSGYGNLVKLPFGIHRKSNNRSSFLDDDMDPVDVDTALSTIVYNDPLALDFIIDMKSLVEPSDGHLAIPSKNFNYNPKIMEIVLRSCWYYRELERVQTSPGGQIHYHDWWNYITMFARFGEKGVERIMRFSAYDERFDYGQTLSMINYVRERGYHQPSCKRLKEGPGDIHCPLDPKTCKGHVI